MTFVLPFILSLVVSMSLLPTLVRFSERLMLVDRPGDRKVHTAPIPRVGGIAIAVGVLAAVSSSDFALDGPRTIFLYGALVIFLSGLLDDRFDLDYRAKFLGQLVACSLPVFLGDLRIETLEIGERVELGNTLSAVLTMFFMVGVTNAVNLTDGLDGLAGGTVFLCLCALAWLSFITGQHTLTGLCLSFSGATLGFLRFNTHPATVFMGDAGSQLLGYAIGGLAILATQESSAAVSASLPILLLGIPILDTTQVMVRRLMAGKSPFRPDRSHLHHRLLGIGFEHHEAVMAIYLAQLLLLIVAYAELYQPDNVILLTYALFCGAFLGVLSFAERRGLRIRELGQRVAEAAPLARLVERAYSSGALLRAAIGLLVAGLAGFAVLTVTGLSGATPDIRVSVAALVVVAAALVVRRRDWPLGLADKGVLYATIAAYVYCGAAFRPDDVFRHHADWFVLLVVALATVVALRSQQRRGFDVTSLDLLVLFVTLVIPNLPGVSGLINVSPLQLAKLVVFFYGIELVLTVPRISPLAIRLATAAALAALWGGLAWVSV